MELKNEFYQYLKKIGKDEERVQRQFELYYELLLEENQKINLFSRKMNAEEIWTIHFMDSVSLAEVYPAIENEVILDFGTGGGMPGIPINILYPENQIVFLDSIHKKINSIKNFCKKLDLKSADFVCSRIEDINSVWYGKFDRIICRSVKILPQYQKNMLKLLKENGIINLYKAKLYDDVEIFNQYRIIDVSNPLLGERKIIEIKNDKNNHNR